MLRAVAALAAPLVTWAEHGEPFVAAVENGPLTATQFHPEKSGDAGARLLSRTGCGRCEPGTGPPARGARGTGGPAAGGPGPPAVFAVLGAGTPPRRCAAGCPGVPGTSASRACWPDARRAQNGIIVIMYLAVQSIVWLIWPDWWVRGAAALVGAACAARARDPDPRPEDPPVTLTTDHLVLLPAVDVADGQAVRLVQGAAGTETSYGDPLAAALAWQEAGAEWIHLVDLDAAFGRGANRELLAEVVGRLDVDGRAVRRHPRRRLAGGRAGHRLRRVNIGTAALEDPEWCATVIAEHGDRIAVGLDVRGTTLAARGWTEEGGELFEVLARLDADGCARYVVTDVGQGRHAARPEPRPAARRLRGAPTGRSSPAAACPRSTTCGRSPALVPLGVEGAIVGKALYAGAFTLEDALALVTS